MGRTLRLPERPQLPNAPKLSVPELPQLHLPTLPNLPSRPELHVPELPRVQIPDLPKLSVPELPDLPRLRRKKAKKRRKFLPLLVLLGVVALIVSRKRGGGQNTVGTAPAGAKPMPERDPTRPTTTTTPTVEPRASTSTPATTGGAMMGVAQSSANGTEQAAPIASADAPGTLPPDELASTAPDLATWVEGNQSDTDTGEATREDAETDATADMTDMTGTDEAADDETDTTTSGSVDAADDSETLTIVPSADTVSAPPTQGDGWVQVSGQSICPDDFPIKGNANSRIYHMPGSRMYEPTIPEICFATEAAAESLGYRAPKG